MASLELELDRTDRLSQNALSLSGLSIRLFPALIVGFALAFLLFGDTFPLEGFEFGSTCVLFIPRVSFS